MTTMMVLRRLTRERVGIPVADDFFTDAVIDDSVNLAVQYVDAEYRWPWAEMIQQVHLAPGACDIPLDSTWRATRGVFLEGVELSYISSGDLMSFVDEVGRPRVWSPLGNVIAVRPQVQGDTTVVHHWYRQSPLLTNDDDAPLIPDQFTGAIIAKAAQLLSSRESASSDANRHGIDYDGWISRMRRDCRRAATPARVRVRPGGWI